MKSKGNLKGHCLCERTQFEISPPFNFIGHCHCESCRRQTASGFTTFVSVPDGKWSWLGEVPSEYVSSPGRRRYFCPTCGAPAAYQDDGQPGETHFYLALLDDPNALTPNENYHSDEMLAWIQLLELPNPTEAP